MGPELPPIARAFIWIQNFSRTILLQKMEKMKTILSYILFVISCTWHINRRKKKTKNMEKNRKKLFLIFLVTTSEKGVEMVLSAIEIFWKGKEIWITHITPLLSSSTTFSTHWYLWHRYWYSSYLCSVRPSLFTPRYWFLNIRYWYFNIQY